MRIIALVVLALLTTPVVAMAKGPVSGSVSGPGLAAPIKLDGTGEWNEHSPLALLTADSGIYDHSKHPPRPPGELGPRYDVRLVFPRHSTGKPDFVVRQHLYPYAEHGPTVYTLRGQPIFDDTFRTTGGWYRVPRILIKRLHLPARAVPARATVSSKRPAGGGPSPLWAIAGIAIVAVVAWRGYDQRRRHPVASRTP
jgi:hypothetical protein